MLLKSLSEKSKGPSYYKSLPANYQAMVSSIRDPLEDYPVWQDLALRCFILKLIELKFEAFEKTTTFDDFKLFED